MSESARTLFHVNVYVPSYIILALSHPLCSGPCFPVHLEPVRVLFHCLLINRPRDMFLPIVLQLELLRKGGGWQPLSMLRRSSR